MQQLRFIWDHLGRLRKWILAGCLLMTKATDVLGWLPDRWKQHIEWLFPSWSRIWWLVIFLSLVATFVIEESYSRQHPQLANPGKKSLRLPTYALAAIGLFWVINVVWERRQSHPAAPTVAQGVPPSSDTAPAQPTPVQPVAKPAPPKIQDAPGTNAPPVVHHVEKPRRPKPTAPVATAQSAPVTQAPAAPAQSSLQQPTYSQKCEGSNCFQGNNNGTLNQQLNQFGAPDWETILDGDKQKTLIKALEQAQGKVRFTWLFQDVGGMKMVGFLNAAFTEAKWTNDTPPNSAGVICYPTKPSDCLGLTITVKDRNSNIGRTATSAISAFVPDSQIKESDTIPDDRVDISVAKAK